MKSTFFATTAACALVMGAVPAFAQDGPSNEGPSNEGPSKERAAEIGDIVVTAQRRSESVQKTALSISVFSGDTLAKQGISQPDDLTKLATGLQVGGGTSTQIFVRGVGDFGVVATANPAVVVSVNGVSIARPQGVSGNFFDLERVEILKGPQGTLYGRNASGGALNLLPAQPKLNQTGGYINGSYGNYDAITSDGAINLALGEHAAFRAAYQVSDRQGYLTDGRDDDKHQSFRGNLLIEQDALKIRVGAGYIHLGGFGAGLAVIPQIPGQSPWTGTGSAAASAYYYAIAAANFTASGGRSVPVAALDSPDSFAKFQNVNNWNVDAQVDYDFGGATLTVIPGFRRVTAKYSVQPGFNYAPGGFGTNGDTSNQYSLEARLGHAGTRFKWVIGGYAFQEDQTSDFSVVAGAVQRVRISEDLHTKAIAAFGEATFSIFDSLRLIGGLRYTSDTRSFVDFKKTATSPMAPVCLPPAAPPGSTCNLLPAGSNYDSERTFNKVTWKAGFEFDLAPKSMLFATVSTGFKAGGFNQAVDPVVTTRSLAFQPESITAYTLGLRNRFFDNKLQVNLEGFYWDYKDLQLTTLIIDGTGNTSLATQNAGKARLYGFNADVIAKPFSNTTLRGGIEYLNSRYQQFGYVQAAQFTPPGSTGCAVTPSTLPPGPSGPFVNVDCSGLALVRAPKWSGNAGLTQDFALANNSRVTFDTDMSFASWRFTSTSFVANSRAKPYATWGATLTYNAPDDAWFIGGYVRNITNATVYTGGGGDQSPFVTGFVSSTIGAPRTYGVRAGVKF